MDNSWIIDVLGDLRAFAARNDLPKLAEHLDDTVHVAASEIAAARSQGAVSSGVYGENSGSVDGEYAASDNA